MNEWITIWDFIVALFYIVVIVLFSWLYQRKKQRTDKDNVYKYYTPALLAKIVGGVSVCFIYVYYYSGGDTLAYFHDNVTMSKLLINSPSNFLTVLFNQNSDSTFSLFDGTTGWPWYWKDSNTFFVVRLTCLLTFISFNLYIPTTVLLAFLSFLGVWKLFKMFVLEYGEKGKRAAFAILFLPSVVFWGSGLLKDTLMIMFLGLFVYQAYIILMKRQYSLQRILWIIILSYLILSIRPFMFMALLGALAMWIYNLNIQRVTNNFVRIFFAPIVLFIVIGVCYNVLSFIGEDLGLYALDSLLERAVVVQDDLKREYYGGHRFDIGPFDPTITGVLGKTHLALGAALFRPFIWEAGNPVMFISGLENLVVLGLTIWILLKTRVVGLFKIIGEHPLLFFSLVFSLIFGFAVGLTTANFGAMVRYKIPAILLYISMIMLINEVLKSKKELEKKI